MAIVKGENMIKTSDYISEDLESIVKKYEAVEKQTSLKMLRRPADVLARIVDPALPSRLGGVVTAEVGTSRLSHEPIRETKLTVLHDSTLIWHQGASKKNIHRVDSLELVTQRAKQGESSINLDWETTRDLYSLGGDVGFWTKSLEQLKGDLQKRSPVGQTLLWLDVGNTWANTGLVQPKTMNDQVLAYRKLAYGLSLYFDRIVYATIGKGIPLDMWGQNYDPRVRIHHGNILHAIRDFVPNQISWMSTGGK
jgi:hypothetical protein